MTGLSQALCGACLLALAAGAAAQDRQPTSRDVVVTGTKARPPLPPVPPPPASRASVTAERIATTTNAVEVEDALRYLPSLIVRKRHPGDTQAPLATRTSGLGASARSLVYADGVLLSALIGNNNTTASPRWGMVSPHEIASVDVDYGPFSAADPGNAIGGVVRITTRTPDRLEATADAAMSIQRFDRYGMRTTYPARDVGATIGDRFGQLALFASADRLEGTAQPLTYVTAASSAASAGTPATGGVDTVTRTGQPIHVLGAGAIEHQRQTRLTLKAELDLGAVRLGYAGSLFRSDTDAAVDSYLTGVASGLPAYAGTFAIAGQRYALPTGAFDAGLYRHVERQSAHAVTLAGTGGLDWQVVATRYHFDRDLQRVPTTALPAGLAGGAGTITDLGGTGWWTTDARVGGTIGAQTLRGGLHADQVTLASSRRTTADWLAGDPAALVQAATGRTRTLAAWAEDEVTLTPRLSATIGGRQEWWRADEGHNSSLSPPLAATQPARRTARFSAKARIGWTLDRHWRLRAAYGGASRFPTVGELYQLVTTPVPAIPDPDLRPERARSVELAVERIDKQGGARIAFFDETVRDALVSQAGPLPGTSQLGSYVQNVARTHARGIEAVGERRDVLARIDLSGSLTFSSAVTAADPVLPAAVGRQIPGVPRWKATALSTWRPLPGVSLTAAVRLASRFWGTLDHSDIVGDTYQGFGRYLVGDVRVAFAIGPHYRLGLGIDNVGDARYFLFHPFPQRTFHADLGWRY